jgi:hypothetical protein
MPGKINAMPNDADARFKIHDARGKTPCILYLASWIGIANMSRLFGKGGIV